jgi:hypothetical protein
MSKYIKKNPTQTLIYGWDNALGYWFEVEDNTSKIPLVVLDESTLFTGLSRQRYLDVMERFNVSDEHKKAVALDLTF